MGKLESAITFNEKCFTIRGRQELLIGGEFHYFRTPAPLWEDRVLKMKRAGANLVTTYIPWNWHEPSEGKQRWDGDQDLESFLKICSRHDMYVIVKPGPYCCAELDFGGHPDWLIGQNIPIRRLNQAYLTRVQHWYKSVARIIKPFLVTNGGHIVCIQIENEYDHLLNYGDDRIPVTEAVEYFLQLKKFMESEGIDIPKFANEAEFLRGQDIIDTRTYYPNIPTFFDWMWEFEHYDEKIMLAKQGQPHAPTMIMELQKGWFGAHGHPNYYPDLNHTQSVAKSVLMLGASVLNFYMFTGGTTFPFWGCRADEWAADRWGTICIFKPVGCGLTTSYDFGGAFIREWGDLLDGGYKWFRAFTQFARDYKELILESRESNEIVIRSGGEDVQLLHRMSISPDQKLTHPLNKFRIFVKKYQDQFLVCVRNLSPDDRTVDISWQDRPEVLFKGLVVKAHETHILPVNVKIPATHLVVKSASSELLFATHIGRQVHFGLYGKYGRPGTIRLDVNAGECTVISGDVAIEPLGQQTLLRFVHKGIQTVRIEGHYLWIFDEDSAGSIDVLDQMILMSGTHFIRKITQDEKSLSLETEVKTGSHNRLVLVGERPVHKVEIDGTAVPFDHHPAALQHSFTFSASRETGVHLEWCGKWKIKPDSDEITPDFKDSDWLEMEKPQSLESLGLIDHGYIWYRTHCTLTQKPDIATLYYHGNNIDRQFIYVNGHLMRRGRMESAEIDVTDVLQAGTNQISILYQNFFHTKSHPHEGPIVKWSGVMRPLLLKVHAGGRSHDVEIKKLRVRQHLSGELKGYMNPDFVDVAWTELSPVKKYLMDQDIGTILWWRRKFKFRKHQDTRCAVKISIPAAAFRCFLYINGRPVGWYEEMGPQKEFYIPESFLKEENVFAMIQEGPGGYLYEPELGLFFETRDKRIQISF
jgi:hypothetical protein